MADSVASIQSLTLDLPPSCIEFCPAYPSYFCIGTYSLEKDEARAQGDTSRPQNRNGSIILFRLENNTAHCLETIAQPSAILDLRFQPTENRRDIFAVASSTATLSIFRLAPATTDRDSTAGAASAIELVRVVRIDGNDDDVLFLSCAWHPSMPDVVAVSTSTGAVYVIALDQWQQPSIVSVVSVLTHDLEAWTVAFSPFTRPPISSGGVGSGGDDATAGRGDAPTQGERSYAQDRTMITVYSGGDDSFLRYTSCALSTRASPGDEKPLQMPFGACKLSGHEAGVTAILPVSVVDVDGGHIIVTGSYDDHIRVFSILDPVDTSGARRARCLADKHLGGGVWRLKLISQTASAEDHRWRLRVLASCMHAGVRVVDIVRDASGHCHISVVARFEEHRSMNYGSDFQPQPPLACVSTSFYDKLLCLWEIGEDSTQQVEKVHA